MAKAEKIPVDDFNVQLTLSREEAALVMFLTGNITGRSKQRNHSSSIFHALDNALGDKYDVLTENIGLKDNRDIELIDI